MALSKMSYKYSSRRAYATANRSTGFTVTHALFLLSYRLAYAGSVPTFAGSALLVPMRAPDAPIADIICCFGVCSARRTRSSDWYYDLSRLRTGYQEIDWRAKENAPSPPDSLHSTALIIHLRIVVPMPMVLVSQRRAGSRSLRPHRPTLSRLASESLCLTHSTARFCRGAQ